MSEVDEKTTREFSGRLIKVFFPACMIGFPILGGYLLVALVVPFFFSNPPDKLLTAKLTFTSLGLLFGLFQVFLGVLLALIGVTIDYEVKASAGPAKLKLASASPGLLLLIIGNCLFAFSLMREFEVSQRREESPTSNASRDSGADPGDNEDRLRNVTGPE